MKKVIIALILLLTAAVSVNAQDFNVVYKKLDTLKSVTNADTLAVDTLKNVKYKYLMVYVISNDTNAVSLDSVVFESLSPVHKRWTPVDAIPLYSSSTGNVSYMIPPTGKSRVYMFNMPKAYIYRCRLVNTAYRYRNVLLEIYGVNE